jgi:2-aminoethylphosphonate transport system ATP-binding protein
VARSDRQLTAQLAAPADYRDTAIPVATADASAGDGISFEAVTVAYRGTVVLESLSLNVQRGEIVALIGPSGSGKTTALRAVAGFVRPVKGRVRIGDTDVTDLPPYARGIGMVVQNYALFPHMRVADNVAFGLRARKARPELINSQITECLRMVGMSAFRDRFPRELSGGQQQRVAIARALAIRPRVLLLDEPLSALDAQIRRSMVEELAKLHRDLPNLTVLYVTHDQSEALTLADRIAIMRDGRLCAFGSSQSLYRQPPNRFAAEFLGRANLLPVRLDSASADDCIRVSFANSWLTAPAHPDLSAGSTALLCIRPHDLRLGPPGVGENHLVGTVQAVHWYGEQHAVTLDCAGTSLRLVSTPLRTPPRTGEVLGFAFSVADTTLIPEEKVAGG